MMMVNAPCLWGKAKNPLMTHCNQKVLIESKKLRHFNVNKLLQCKLQLKALLLEAYNEKNVFTRRIKIFPEKKSNFREILT